MHKFYRFVDNFVPSALTARRRDQNPHYKVVEETMMFPARSSYGYQIMDSGRHSVKNISMMERHRQRST